MERQLQHRVKLIASPLARLLYALRSRFVRWLGIVALVVAAGFGVNAVLPSVPAAVAWADENIMGIGGILTAQVTTGSLTPAHDTVDVVAARQALELQLTVSLGRDISALRADIVKDIRNMQLKAGNTLENRWSTLSELAVAAAELADADTAS